MTTPLSAPSRCNPHHSSPSAPEWRRLLRLLGRLQALPTASARVRWIERLRRNNEDLANALLQLLEAYEGANVSRFMATPVVARGELRRRVELLMQTRRAGV